MIRIGAFQKNGRLDEKWLFSKHLFYLWSLGYPGKPINNAEFEA